MRYGLNHWDGLTRFLNDGRIELDTNIVERSIRPVVLNRKNALFAGHDEGAANWACIASLIETCKLHGVDPQAYLADVLIRLVNLWPASRLDEGLHALGLGRAPRRKPRRLTHSPLAPQFKSSGRRRGGSNIAYRLTYERQKNSVLVPGEGRRSTKPVPRLHASKIFYC